MREAIVYLEEYPDPNLRSRVRFLWYCQTSGVSHRRERILPDGCTQIIPNLPRSYFASCGEDEMANGRLPRAIVVGARARYNVIDTADMEELVGIVFQPGGFAGPCFAGAPTCFLSALAVGRGFGWHISHGHAVRGFDSRRKAGDLGKFS